MQVATLTYRGLTLWGGMRGQWRDHYLTSLDGWEAFSANRETASRPNAHGQWATRAFVPSKTVIAKGWSKSATRRDEIFQMLAQAMSLPASGGEPQILRVDTMGRDLFAYATVTAFDPWDVYENLKDGFFGWKIEFSLDDPMRYSSSEAGTYTTGLDNGLSSGLEFDLFSDEDSADSTGYLEFGEPNDSGRVVFQNHGTTDAWPEFEVYSPDPFRIVHGETGRTIEYSEPVPEGNTVTINQQLGNALLQGIGDRSGFLSRREWFSIPAGQQGTIRFVTDTKYKPEAKMIVRVRSTYL
ncbi:phage tail domain-containing protein [Kocuria massiliensis]|uniref:phage tail domain-containing protein n=1 Tax=Kocuria massiliensis TaxID=1926282 RepID=UPI0022B962C9|nr:phage tail domain-containing protein [Kocuria massiliensis]